MYNIVKNFLRGLFNLLFRIKVIGKENVPENGGIIVCSNHKSNLDPIILGICFPRQINFMAKVQLFRVPVLGFIIKKLGAFPVKRGEGDIGAIKKSISVVKNSGALAIFPEGKRNKENLGEFKQGMALIADKAMAPIVPVAIIGNYRLFSKITVHIGKPINSDVYAHINEKASRIDVISKESEAAVKNLLEV